MSKKIYFDFGYLILIAATLGAVMALGALVAPIIFHTERILVDMVLDNYHAGIIMGDIFHRFSHWTNFVAGSVVFYELIAYKRGERDSIVFASAAIVVSTSLLFSVIYAPKILDMHSLGVEATQSDTFSNMHKASEIDFKILALALLVLFIRRLMLLRRA